MLGRLVVDQVVHEEVGRLAPGDDLARVGVHRLDDAFALMMNESQLLI